MPSPWDILHNKTFECPGKPSTPVDMEHVHNFLLSRKLSQKQHFNCSHNARELQQLDPDQEVLFLFPAENEYIPRTIINKASTLFSYIIEAQGKCYCRSREHLVQCCDASFQSSQQTSPVLSFNEIHLNGVKILNKQTALKLVCSCESSFQSSQQNEPCSTSFNEIHLNGIKMLNKIYSFEVSIGL